MPVSVSSSKLIYGGLKDAGVRIVSALPETWLVHLIRMAEEDRRDDPGAAGEGRGGRRDHRRARTSPGVKSAMLMQNHGFLAAINGIVSCAQLYRIPLLMLISHRGEFGETDPWQTEGGGVTEHVLQALRIPYDRLESPEHVGKRIAKAQTLAYSASRPVALLLCRDLMWEE